MLYKMDIWHLCSFYYFLCNEVMGVDYGRGEGDGWEGSGGWLLGRRPGARWDVD